MKTLLYTKLILLEETVKLRGQENKTLNLLSTVSYDNILKGKKTVVANFEKLTFAALYASPSSVQKKPLHYVYRYASSLLA